MKIRDKSVGDKHGGFSKDKGCVDQIFILKLLLKST